MQELNSPHQFKILRDRLEDSRDPAIPVITISAGTCGQASGANDLIRVTKRELLKEGLADKIHLRITGCHGFCEMEPSVLVEPQRTFYPKIKQKDMVQIVRAVANGKVVSSLLLKDPAREKPFANQDDVPFYAKQSRTILARNEKIDPIRIYNYIENGGYSAMVKALEKADPRWVINEVKASGLRGRGGAGFPTGFKWELLAAQPNGRGKFIVCNADEGDPGAYMDRSVLEGNPHSIIEGMIIGAYGTGATEGVIYVRNEYPLAIKHLIIALRQARELGLLGKDILGTGFDFDINLVRGAGAFVCGEETALMKSIAGKVGEPTQRPPFPVEKGIDGKPTAINNVETWANIPVIIRDGAAEFSKQGTKNNSGTKIFSLVGKVKYTGLVEVPMGITIEKIVNDIGGGPIGKARIKAVQTGGPSGGCIPARLFNLTVDYDSLAKAGSIMGSGGLIVMDENTCMVDVAKYFMSFLKDESCGKCFTCRKGTQRMYEILEDVSEGKGSLEELGLLEELAEVVKDTTMCGLGQTASNPVLSTLRYFRDEYERHVRDKRCDAFVCKGLVGAPCATACPVETEGWRYIAHIERGEYEEAYRVIRENNPFPSVCARACSHPCEERCRVGTQGGEAVAIRALKRFVTDRVDPSVYKPLHAVSNERDGRRIAVIGSGPAGLTCAHYLSLKGHKVTVFEKEDEPGGMLISTIPAYRLPRETVRKEIKSLLNKNVTMKCGVSLGKDITMDKLFKEGFHAVFLAIGAHKSLGLGLPREKLSGVYPSISFLKAFNLHKERLANGHVGVIGGGNSAVDAARVALRQPGVKTVTIFYRRSQEEMPAFGEEVAAALEEGVKLETLVSPIRVISKGGHLSGIEFVRNALGEFDSSGRRRPVSIPDSEFSASLDTLIVATGEIPDTDCIVGAGDYRISVAENRRTVLVDPETLCTNRPGVFAGGDLVTGPNTIVDAIAAGKRAATMIDLYLRNEKLHQPARWRIPRHYIEPAKTNLKEAQQLKRVEIPCVPVDSRKRKSVEVEKALSAREATRESRRCLRCDLEFTKPGDEKTAAGSLEKKPT
ncbi:MAG: FAD-dependent oxidoreductase [Candidatus Eisenbacteria bacterium]|nr:FAD-dependent oxidoreductase [Candidatus Eisenbacteria bacterium]